MSCEGNGTRFIEKEKNGQHRLSKVKNERIEIGVIATVKNMFRFHDALNPSIHLAGLPFPGRKGQTCQAGTEESEHIFDNSYNRVGLPSVQYPLLGSDLLDHKYKIGDGKTYQGQGNQDRNKRINHQNALS